MPHFVNSCLILIYWNSVVLLAPSYYLQVNEGPAPELEACYNWREMTLSDLPEAVTRLVTEPTSKGLKLGIHSEPKIRKETIPASSVQGCQIGQYMQIESSSSSHCEGTSPLNRRSVDEGHLFDKSTFPCGSTNTHEDEENKSISCSSVDSIDYQSGTWICGSGTYPTESTSQGSSTYSPLSKMQELEHDKSLQESLKDSIDKADGFPEVHQDERIEEALVPIQLFERSDDSGFIEDNKNSLRTGSLQETHENLLDREISDLGEGQTAMTCSESIQKTANRLTEYRQGFSIQNEIEIPVEMCQQTKSSTETALSKTDGMVEVNMPL